MNKNFAVVNSMVTLFFGVPIDLEGARGLFSNYRYDKKRFSGAIVKFTEPKITLLLFSPGKAVVTGGKTNVDIHAAIWKVYKALQARP